MEQAREVLPEMGEEQEITAESDEWKASIKKHNDQEYSASLVEHETGIISLRDASYILLEHGDHDLHLTANSGGRGEWTARRRRGYGIKQPGSGVSQPA